MTGIHIYLVPGFFGFSQLGALNYFHRVKETLDTLLRKRNIHAKIVECKTQPTGSIKFQADRLIQEVIDSGGLDADDIHFVGHSTGGLNARLLVTPGVRLLDSHVEDRIGEKTRSVITVAAPHYGTPLASFFTSFQGRNTLQILTLLATTTSGRRTIFLASRLLGAVAHIDDVLGKDQTFLDELLEKLLRKLTLDPTDPIWQFLREISIDQGAIIQLTPESMHIFNAAVSPRPSVSYRCLLTAAPPPSLFLRENFTSFNSAAMSLLFALLYTLTSREHRCYPYPQADEKTAELIASKIPFDLTPTTNDGIVPTMSQISGEVIDVVVANHLDVVGQFPNAGGNPLGDWLPAGTDFNEERFVRVWESIASAIDEIEGETR
jgi:triacylglycerol esterase/lipase EstA (alpha/beta hydrolase family)